MGEGHSPLLQQAWKQYGPDAFVFEVLEECARELLDEREDEHMRGGCAFNHIQPLPRLEIRLDDPQFAHLFKQLDEALAAMTDEERAAYMAELDAEEKAEEAEEAAQEAAGNALDEFCATLYSKAKGEAPSAQEVQQADAYLAQGETIPALVAARAFAGAQQFDAAEQLVLKACDGEELDAAKEDCGVGPAPYEWLAKFYRKRKRHDDEIGILERYARQRHAPGAMPAQLMLRLEKSKALREVAGRKLKVRGG